MGLGKRNCAAYTICVLKICMKGKITITSPTKGIRWAFSPDLTRGMIPLDPHRRMLHDSTRKQTPAVDWKDIRLGAVMASGPDEPPMTACGGNSIGGEIRRNEQCPLCGLATIEPAERAAIPDAKHPVKVWKNPRGKLALPLGFFQAILGQKPTNIS